jgi:hypothetical protein
MLEDPWYTQLVKKQKNTKIVKRNKRPMVKTWQCKRLG